jgi:hypothetical protein
MPTHVGPNILGEENLVFGYDLSDQKNSYIGEPTTNYFSSFTIANANLSGGDVTTTIPDGTIGTVYRVNVNVNSSFSRAVMYVNIPNSIPQANVSYTISHWIRTISDVPVAAGWEAETGPSDGYLRPTFESGYIGDYNSLQQPNDISSVWERVSYTYSYDNTMTSGIVPFIYFGSPIGGTQDTIGATVDFYGFQFEVNSHPTPFVNGTRSTTQGLLDLTGNSTINLSSVSFDSNSQMVFDGTDDFITAGNNPYLAPGIGNFTYSCWINPVGYSYYAGLLVVAVTGGLWIGKLGSNMVLRAYNVEDHLQYSTLPTVGQWTNVVITRDGTAVTLYYNANSVATATTGYNFVQATAYIGNDGPISSANFNGKITNTSFYNRALSSSEVLNNYNNIKRKY